jgi:cyclopropane fatty-acyl-phospholipid synthase-like methyltransferase
VGCGPGELAERVARDLGADVVALDQSERSHQHLAARLPQFDEPLVVTRHMTVFVATK